MRILTLAQVKIVPVDVDFSAWRTREFQSFRSILSPRYVFSPVVHKGWGPLESRNV